MQNWIISADIDIAYKSDHSPVYIEIEFVKQERGAGTWKFNNSLLGDPESVDLVKSTINEVVGQYRTDNNDSFENEQYSIDDNLLWETMKGKSKREVPRDVRNSKVRRQDKLRRDWSRH